MAMPVIKKKRTYYQRRTLSMNLSANWPHQNKKKKLVNTDRSIEIKPTETQRTKRPKPQSNTCKSCRTIWNPCDWRGQGKRMGKGNT